MLKDNKIHTFLTAIFLLFLCLLTYGDTLTHRFMIDERIFLDHQGSAYTDFHHLGDFFIKPHNHHYSPFYYLFNEGLFRFFQNPFPFYLINLVLFYINCGLLFVLVYLISKKFITALLTSIIFCVHPMTGDILQHITFNILFIQTIFIESGLIALFLYAKQGRPVFYYFFSLLMVFLALFCHEIVLLFPLYAAALLFFLTDLNFKRVIKLIVPYILLSLLLIAVWGAVVNPSVQLYNMKALRLDHFWDLSANFSRVFFWYLSNLLVPRDIVFMCSMAPLSGFIWLWNFLFFGFWAGCGLVIFFYFKKSLESFSLVLFLTGFIFAFPASLARINMGIVFEPNWLYFSSIGFYLFIVLLLLRFKEIVSRPLIIIFVSALFMFLFCSTLNINIKSRTEISYAENWLKKFPGNMIAMEITASYYMNHKDADIPPDIIPELFNLVDVYIKDRAPAAFGLIERISSAKISLSQKNELFYKLTAYHCANGHNEQCGECIRQIIAPKKDPNSYMKLSYALFSLGDEKTAVTLLNQCITLYPGYKEPYLLMGVILGNNGNYEKSISYWKQGFLIDPTDVRFVSNIEKAGFLIEKKAK